MATFEQSPSWYAAAEYALKLPVRKKDGYQQEPLKKDAAFEAMKKTLAGPLKLDGLAPVKHPWNNKPYKGKDLPAVKPSLFRDADEVLAFPGVPFAARKIVKKATAAEARYRISSYGIGDQVLEFGKLLPGTIASVETKPLLPNQDLGLTGVYDVGALTVRLPKPPKLYVATDTGLVEGALDASDLQVGEGYCSNYERFGTDFTLPKPVKGRILGAFLAPKAIDPAKAKLSRSGKANLAGLGTTVWQIDLDADGIPDLAAITTTEKGQVTADTVTTAIVAVNLDGHWQIGAWTSEADCT